MRLFVEGHLVVRLKDLVDIVIRTVITLTRSMIGSDKLAIIGKDVTNRLSPVKIEERFQTG